MCWSRRRSGPAPLAGLPWRPAAAARGRNPPARSWASGRRTLGPHPHPCAACRLQQDHGPAAALGAEHQWRRQQPGLAGARGAGGRQGDRRLRHLLIWPGAYAYCSFGCVVHCGPWLANRQRPRFHPQACLPTLAARRQPLPSRRGAAPGCRGGCRWVHFRQLLAGNGIPTMRMKLCVKGQPQQRLWRQRCGRPLQPAGPCPHAPAPFSAWPAGVVGAADVAAAVGGHGAPAGAARALAGMRAPHAL